LADTPACSTSLREIKCVDAPTVLNETDLSAASLKLLIGLLPRTYQNRSGQPMNTDEMILIGAPCAAAPMTPMVPTATPMSTLPEVTACCVSPLPDVNTISRSRPCSLKNPLR